MEDKNLEIHNSRDAAHLFDEFYGSIIYVGMQQISSYNFVIELSFCRNCRLTLIGHLGYIIHTNHGHAVFTLFELAKHQTPLTLQNIQHLTLKGMSNRIAWVGQFHQKYKNLQDGNVYFEKDNFELMKMFTGLDHL